MQLPPDTDLESVRIKVAYDLYYVQHVNFLFDVRIYAATFFKVVGLSFQSIQTLCLFPRRDAVELNYQARPVPPRTSTAQTTRRDIATATPQRAAHS